jgi:AcrR family transcriptional regulator
MPRRGGSAVSTTSEDDLTPPPVAGPRRRAPALPPAQRRAAIVDAALALLLEHGAGVTTRRIAEAAGVAEGTLFRAFPDKPALLAAVLDTVFDPSPVRAELSLVPLELPLEDRLTRAVAILQERVSVIWQVMSAVGITEPPPRHRPAVLRDAPDSTALAALFEPDADALCYSPSDAAQLLRALTFACSFPVFVADRPRAPAEIVSLLLDGLRSHPRERPNPEVDGPC